MFNRVVEYALGMLGLTVVLNMIFNFVPGINALLQLIVAFSALGGAFYFMEKRRQMAWYTWR